MDYSNFIGTLAEFMNAVIAEVQSAVSNTDARIGTLTGFATANISQHDVWQTKNILPASSNIKLGSQDYPWDGYFGVMSGETIRANFGYFNSLYTSSIGVSIIACHSSAWFGSDIGVEGYLSASSFYGKMNTPVPYVSMPYMTSYGTARALLVQGSLSSEVRIMSNAEDYDAFKVRIYSFGDFIFHTPLGTDVYIYPNSKEGYITVLDNWVHIYCKFSGTYTCSAVYPNHFLKVRVPSAIAPNTVQSYECRGETEYVQVDGTFRYMNFSASSSGYIGQTIDVCYCIKGSVAH